MTVRTLLTALCLALAALSGAAWALNSPDEEVVVRKLTAAEIMDLTQDKTWVIDFDDIRLTSTTFYKANGLRYTERDGLVEEMEWFVDEDANQRCVRSGYGTRCGFIVSFGSTVKICMQLNPLGDCSYTVVRIEEGDPFGLESRAAVVL